MSFAFWKKREVAESPPAPTAPDTVTNGHVPQAGPSLSVDFAGLRPALDEPTTTQPKRRLTLDALKARIRRYNCDLESNSDTFRAAVLLLAAYEAGHNVELLSRRTAYPRPFVSKCARRLIDNGVWSAGQTIADWSPDDEASGAFWNDVGVALGKLCRRADEHGVVEWAPPGYWNKRYDYVTPEDSPVSTTYHDAAMSVEEYDLTDDLNVGAPRDEGNQPSQSSDGHDAMQSDGVGTSPDSGDSAAGTNGHGKQASVAAPKDENGNGGGQTTPRNRIEPTPQTPALAPTSADDPGNLFPDAVWLG